MSRYDEVLAFMLENGVQMDKDQLNELRDICEANEEQIKRLAETDPETIKKFNRGLYNKLHSADKKVINAENSAKKAWDNANNLANGKGGILKTATSGIKAGKDIIKAAKSKINADDAIVNTMNKDEEAAYKENERRDEAKQRVIDKAVEKKKKEDEKAAKKATAEKAKEEKKAAKLPAKVATAESTRYEEVLAFMLENGVQMSKEQLDELKRLTTVMNTELKKSKESDDTTKADNHLDNANAAAAKINRMCDSGHGDPISTAKEAIKKIQN